MPLRKSIVYTIVGLLSFILAIAISLLKLGVEGSGGGTDDNYTASVGATTLDALGPVGGGAHSSDEYIDVDRIAARIYLLCKLMMKLGAS